MMGKTRIEELCYELYGSSKQHDSWQRYAMVRELRELMKRPKASGSERFERSGDEKQLPVIDDETDLLGTGTIVDPTTEICEKLVHKAILEEKSTSQFQVPIANSEIVRISEPGKVDLGLGNEESVELNENLEQEGGQKNAKKKTDVVGEVERDQKLISDANTCCAHKVFVKMSQHQERLGIKKKKKGIKSWMFKYKKGNRKLHTLLSSNNIELVYPQMRKAETSSYLLLLNGRGRLALRAIGTELETGETYSSNQERNELCTENKEEVKGCLERLPVSVLMEEEPDSMRVNEVKLENKMTWTKLKVKKHDNLSWKEDESRSIGCIMKLGGVEITCKKVLEKIYDEKLEIVACQSRPAMMESSFPSRLIGKDGFVKLNLRYILLADQRIWEKETHAVGITDAYPVLQDEFEQVVNHTPFSVVKLERLKDPDALLLLLPGDESFQIKHKWRFKLLHNSLTSQD